MAVPRIGPGLQLRLKHQKLQRVKLEAMRAIANNSVNFFKVTVFNAQGFIFSGGVQRWKKRKPTANDRRSGRKILVDTGAGRQSIKVVSVSMNTAVVRAEAEYMRYHNEGTGKLPQRKFIGHSVKLDKQNITILLRKLRTVL